MAIGPVQLIVLGFDHPEFHGEIKAELERLRESDTIRVIDALAAYKDANGDVEVEHLSNLTRDEAIELGTTIGALIGLGADGEEGFEAGAVAGAEIAAEGGVQPISNDPDAWDILEGIPNDSAAALILVEHQWAVGLRDAVCAPAASGSATASSARSIWSRSGCSRPRRPRSTTSSRQAASPRTHDNEGGSPMMGSRRVARRTARRVSRRR